MNIDLILSEMNTARVDYLLIGGVNFLLRHNGPLTHDVDVWVNDSDENLVRVISALRSLMQKWGPQMPLGVPFAAI